MRSLQTKEHAEARQKKRQLIGGLVLIAVMVLSSVGYAFSLFTQSSTGGTSTQGEVTFDGIGWVIPYGSTQFRLVTSPEEAKTVPINVSVRFDDYYNKPVYVSANSSAIIQELGGVLSAVALRVQEACYGPCDAPNLPEKDCSEPLIVWQAGNTNQVRQQNLCIFIDGDIRAADAFLYRLLGIL